MKKSNPFFFVKWFTILLFILVYIKASAQYQGYNWYFYDSTGISFLTKPPSPIKNSVFAYGSDGPEEGAAAISDSAGNILFYADPRQIWNSSNQLMDNGQGLLGGASSTQGVIIIPMPEHDSLYYVFTLDEQQDSLKNGLNYSIVDMCLDCGKGAVLPNFKNIHLLDSAGEKMAATYHSNGTDIWILVHQYYTDAFYAYLLTKNGLSQPVISHIGAKHIGFYRSDGATIWGQMKISPNGKKIALGLSEIDTVIGKSGLQEIFDFNNNTGKVSNEIQLSKYYYYSYGVAFSPDNSKLYMSCISPVDAGIFQYDLSLADPRHSDTMISYPMSPTQLQLGPDGKIYLANFYHRHYLSCISNPNAKGAASGFVGDAIFLGSRSPDLGLPSFIDNFVYHNKGRRCKRAVVKKDTTLCYGVIYKIIPPHSTSGYLWQDGSTDSTYTVSKAGTYTVQLTTPQTCSETYSLKVSYLSELNTHLPNDTILCPGDVYKITLPLQSGASYTWSDNKIGNNFTIYKAGKYYVTENYKGCKKTDTILVLVFDTAIKIPLIPGDTSICPGQKILIDLHTINWPIKWQDGSTSKYYLIRDSGSYSFEIENCVNHKWRIKVSYRALPVNTIKDTTLCVGTSYIARLADADTSFYHIWSDGSGADSMVINTAGKYWVKFVVGSCTVYNNFNVSYQKPPGHLFPADTNLCPGKDIVLNVSSKTGNLTWADGSKDTSYTVLSPGIYTLNISNACGHFTQSVNVKIDTIHFNIGKLITGCEGRNLMIDETGNGERYHWSDGDTLPIIKISKPGYYWIEITKKGCMAYDSFRVRFDSNYTNKRFFSGDTTICIGKSISINLDTTLGKLMWDNGLQSNNLIISNAGSYSATLSNACGAFTEYFNVSELDCSCPVYAPSAFTPNKDSINPVFNVISQCRFKNFRLEIFNRWGEMIFSTNDSQKGWDGTFKGSVCEDGIYLWTLVGENIRNKLVFQYGEVALLK